jgi:deazaflavin-dependent oxidoreductase (nitroreductase family)
VTREGGAVGDRTRHRGGREQRDVRTLGSPTGEAAPVLATTAGRSIHRVGRRVLALVVVTPHGGGLPSPVWTCLLLTANAVLTRMNLGVKWRIIRPLQRYVINPPIRLLLAIGVLPLGYALIETSGRVSTRPRRTPVGNGLVEDTFWIVAEHGRNAGYVRNIARYPRVRVKVRRGLRPIWRVGTAYLLDDDDPYARQRFLSRWHPLRALNAAVVRVMGTDLLTVRIDLDA